ncbi:MAG TPA: patatin-like phospholipase family protein [Solirubrobacteraceae bacterium]|nr:patatin-like phospholipase family protein [Solirubrobacteraceae bacterium]
MPDPQQPSVGLVLGAGGVLGAAWLAGALDAIARETGWDPGSADHVVGTSAGSVVAALLACGVPPWLMVARSGEAGPEGPDAGGGEPSAGHAHWSQGARFRLHRGRPALGPGSWRLAAGALARPYRYSPAAMLAGVMPDGAFSTEPIRDVVRPACRGAWAPHPGLSVVAVDYGSGRRVAFGRPGAPAAELPDAVAASCAIPGFYRSVRIGGRRYVDGGVHSTSNLDLLAGLGLDLVICLNPTSSLHSSSPRTLGERLAFALRQTSGRRLGAEAGRVRASGTEVILIQPTVHDLDAMGSNLMSHRRRHRVLETATATVTEHLRESPVGERLAGLPAGRPELVRRPPGSPAAWPDLYAAAERRAAAVARVDRAAA